MLMRITAIGLQFSMISLLVKEKVCGPCLLCTPVD